MEDQYGSYFLWSLNLNMLCRYAITCAHSSEMGNIYGFLLDVHSYRLSFSVQKATSTSHLSRVVDEVLSPIRQISHVLALSSCSNNKERRNTLCVNDSLEEVCVCAWVSPLNSLSQCKQACSQLPTLQVNSHINQKSSRVHDHQLPMFLLLFRHSAKSSTAQEPQLAHSYVGTYSAFANSCPLQTDPFLFPLVHSHNVLLSSNKFYQCNERLGR